MRLPAGRLFAAASLLATSVFPLSAKLTDEQKIELLRGLTAEYATVKVTIPRSKRALPFDARTGAYDKEKWGEAGKEFGPAARVGDLVQVTKIGFDDDQFVLEVNGGLKTRGKWYERIEVGMGSGNRTTPVNSGQTSTKAGTSIALKFDKANPPATPAEVKKLLAPILDFEKRSATESYLESLPPEVKQAVEEKRAIEGMDRDQVILAVGKPLRKVREMKDGVELEDWVYGQAPGRVTFITFDGPKVVKVKESYAGLGGSTAPRLPTP